MTSAASIPMRVLTVALCVAAVVVLTPLWAPLLCAAWCAELLRPAVRWLERHVGGRRRAAAVLVVVVTIGLLVPIVGLAGVLSTATHDYVEQFRAALEGERSLTGALLGGDVGGPQPSGTEAWAELASRYGARAWGALSLIGRASARAAIAGLVFGAALYSFAADGERAFGWLAERAPIPRDALDRLTAAFHETGRGLIVAGGGTAIAQGIVATLAYVALGIPRALILGPITALCAVVPFIGTGLVWIPLAIELASTGLYWRAGAVVALGVGVHSVVDNVVRPVLARYGRLQLPTVAVLVSMLGGAMLLGPTGALLGPLVVRLCVEALAIDAERRRGEAR